MELEVKLHVVQVWSALKAIAVQDELRFEMQPPFGLVVQVQ